MIKFDDYLMEKLQDEEFAQAYINVALEEFFKDHNKEMFLISLDRIAQTKGEAAVTAKAIIKTLGI